MATLGMPLTSTRGFGDTGVAWPAWAQVKVAPTCSRKPGIVTASSVDLYVMASAPVLIVTVGPTIVIDAPLPFDIKTPASFTTRYAPVVLRSVIPPGTGVPGGNAGSGGGAG